MRRHSSRGPSRTLIFPSSLCLNARSESDSGERAFQSRDVLHITIEVKAPSAPFSADPRIPAATERRGQLAHEVTIDPHRARHDLTGDAHRPLLIPAEDHSGQTIARAVGEL